jgi:cell division protein FtsI (penicillin-binding protein 3)
MDTKRDILARVYLSFIAIALLGMLVLGRAVYIQRVQGSYWRALSDSMRQRFVSLDAQRGTIYTENGEMLSTSVPTFDVYIDFKADGLRVKNGAVFYEKIDSFARAMSGYFGDRSAKDYADQFKAAYKRGDRYFSLKKKLSFEQYKAFRQFPMANLGRNKSGLIVEVNSKRLVPYGILASRTIGLSREHVQSDGKVKKMNVGLEKSYDSLLSGRDGQRMVRFVAPGTAIPVDGTETEPIDGKDIYTTIDLAIQDITEQALLRQVTANEALYGTAIVMETATGKIKAIANLGRRPDGSYWEDDNYALRNTEPGSTIKLVTLMAVLEKGTSRVTDSVLIGSAQTAQVGPRPVTDAERSKKPVLTVQECFAHSSNIGMSRLALKAFGQRPTELMEYMHRFRMDERLALDLSDLPKPRFAALDQKGSAVGDMLSMSYGYASRVSALHTLTLYNTVANGGKMMKPYLVSSIRQGGIVYRQFDPQVMVSSIARPDVIEAARRAMEMVTVEGTAAAAFKGLPFTVAGKTGTALVWDGPYKYKDGVYQASFAGYFPADQPTYSCIVLIRSKPGASNIYGGTLAAPVFREIATKLHALYVVSPRPTLVQAKADSTLSQYAGRRSTLSRVYASLGLTRIDSTNKGSVVQVRSLNAQRHWQGSEVSASGMPDLRGMSLRDALMQVEGLRMGIQIDVKGKGKISGQSIAPGTPLVRGTKLVLQLS